MASADTGKRRIRSDFNLCTGDGEYAFRSWDGDMRPCRSIWYNRSNGGDECVASTPDRNIIDAFPAAGNTHHVIYNSVAANRLDTQRRFKNCCYKLIKTKLHIWRGIFRDPALVFYILSIYLFFFITLLYSNRIIF